ncbi:hypothetical protein Pcinc_001219 [Petrolisthes cinctipes]|nr:hypothetical protein Pcinc_001219 [Petrolisthes cinctipes]
MMWGPLQADAFQKAKDALAAAALPAFPAPGNPLIVTTDDYDITIWAVLEQVTHTLWVSSSSNSLRLKRTTPLSTENISPSTKVHLTSKKNPVADFLSRVEIDALKLGLDYNHLAKEQQCDPETTAARSSITAL